MRAHTKGKSKRGAAQSGREPSGGGSHVSKRFAIAIVSAVAAAGVMALGAQTAAATVVKYDTNVTITKDNRGIPRGFVLSDRDRHPEYHPRKAVRKCMRWREVQTWRQLPGANRLIDRTFSRLSRRDRGVWHADHDEYEPGWRVYALVKRETNHPARGEDKPDPRIECRPDRSRTITIE